MPGAIWPGYIDRLSDSNPGANALQSFILFSAPNPPDYADKLVTVTSVCRIRHFWNSETLRIQGLKPPKVDVSNI